LTVNFLFFQKNYGGKPTEAQSSVEASMDNKNIQIRTSQAEQVESDPFNFDDNKYGLSTYVVTYCKIILLKSLRPFLPRIDLSRLRERNFNVSGELYLSDEIQRQRLKIIAVHRGGEKYNLVTLEKMLGWHSYVGRVHSLWLAASGFLIPTMAHQV